jgi:hypothetical protein
MVVTNSNFYQYQRAEKTTIPAYQVEAGTAVLKISKLPRANQIRPGCAAYITL